jgi:hypothetical protein
MQTDMRLQLQKQIYAKLTGNAPLMAKLTGVYDFVPDNKTYPYLQIGEADYTPWNTKTFQGFDGSLTINLWHRPGSRGRAPLHDIMHDVYNLLHNSSLTIANSTVVLLQMEFSNIIVDPDAVTYHGVQRFRTLMGEK